MYFTRTRSILYNTVYIFFKYNRAGIVRFTLTFRFRITAAVVLFFFSFVGSAALVSLRLYLTPFSYLLCVSYYCTSSFHFSCGLIKAGIIFSRVFSSPDCYYAASVILSSSLAYLVPLLTTAYTSFPFFFWRFAFKSQSRKEKETAGLGWSCKTDIGVMEYLFFDLRKADHWIGLDLLVLIKWMILWYWFHIWTIKK